MEILQGVHVLLLEDDFLINEATADVLQEFGCTVTAVFDIAAALDAIEQRRPKVGVLDINIRGSDSFPVAERLHELNIPIVFLTGYEMPAMKGPWSQHPVCRKPCDADQLKLFLAAALSTQRDQPE